MTTLEGVILASVGMATAALGTLIGVGGGFLLMPFIVFFYPGITPEVATFIVLCMVAANAASGAIGYASLRRIDYRSGLAFAGAATPMAVAGVEAVRRVGADVFLWIFGGLLLIAGGFVFLRTVRSGGEGVEGASRRNGSPRRLMDSLGQEYKYTVNMKAGLGASAAIGFVSSFLGIGGGIAHVPLLTQALRFPVRVATATSHFILAITALVGVVTHLALGSGLAGWERSLPLMAGAVAGAQAGTRLARRTDGRIIMGILAVCMALSGLRMMLQAGGG